MTGVRSLVVSFICIALLSLFSLATARQLEVIGHLRTDYSLGKFSKSGSEVVIFTDAPEGRNNILLIDVGDPYSPVLQGGVEVQGYDLGASVGGDFLFVQARIPSEGILLYGYDITDPYAPTQRSFYRQSQWGYGGGVLAYGDVLYASIVDYGAQGTLEIFDASDPGTILYVSELWNCAGPRLVRPDTLECWSFWGFDIICRDWLDISDPFNPGFLCEACSWMGGEWVGIYWPLKVHAMWYDPRFEIYDMVTYEFWGYIPYVFDERQSHDMSHQYLISYSGQDGFALIDLSPFPGTTQTYVHDTPGLPRRLIFDPDDELFYLSDGDSGFSILAWTTGLRSPEKPIPTDHALSIRCYPNPFNSLVTIDLWLDAGEGPGDVVLDIFDVSGRLIRRLSEAELPAEGRRVTWDGMNASGDAVSSGIYFLRAQSAYGTEFERLILLK